MIPDEAVEAAAKALWDVDREDGTKEYKDCRDGTKRHLRREARAALETAAPFIAAQALGEAADDLARLPYVKPGDPGRAEYERVLAVRRGDADTWLRDRATILRGPCVTG